MASLLSRDVLVELTPRDIQSWFEISATTARKWLHEWTMVGFVEATPTEMGKRVRRFALTSRWRELIKLAMDQTERTK